MPKMFTPDEEFTLIYHRDEELRHWKKNAGLQVSNGAVAEGRCVEGQDKDCPHCV